MVGKRTLTTMQINTKNNTNGREAVLLFSGGYDSVAMLHKMIMLGEFDFIRCLFEKSVNLVNSYEIKNAKKIFKLFKNGIAKEKNVRLEWVEIDFRVDCAIHFNTQDFLLNMHLNILFLNSDIKRMYIGWDEESVKNLNMAKKTLDWFRKSAKSEYEINFLETYFIKNHTKEDVVRYLLINNIFNLPYSSEVANETEKSFKERELWYEYDGKDIEVMTALIKTFVFDKNDISKIFNFKTTKEIQELYNKKGVKNE